MSYKARASDWDSDLFNRRIGLLDLEELPLIEKIRKDNRSHFDVVFVKCPGWAFPSSSVTALDYRYDMEIENSKSVVEKKHRDTIALMGSPSEYHYAIARTAFQDSRFLLDPVLCTRTYEFYSRWLALSPLVYALKDLKEMKCAFIASSYDSDKVPRISLIATHKSHRGTGIGERLVKGVFDYEKNPTWRVKVSARNHRGIRFYENIGFRVKSISTAFHVWMDEGELE